MKTVIELDNLPYKIQLKQTKQGRFRVVYGKQVKHGLSYAQAAIELGSSIMHAAALNGDMDSEHNSSI